jgi:16S rRNA (uracil1498-N3)-methyltransferase
MSERFHVNCTLSSGNLELDGPEAHHLAVVCRVRPGDRVCLFNGDGREYPSVVESVSKHCVHLQILGVESPGREHPGKLLLAAPLPKGDRAQFLVEKLTELGVMTFVPLHTARSVIHPRQGHLDKLNRYVIEASKQCGRNVLMTIEPLAEFPSFCTRQDLPALRLLAHPGAEVVNTREVVPEVALAVGPEGGFTEEEIGTAQQAGWRVVGLGPRILRIETAALVLASRFALEEDSKS